MNRIATVLTAILVLASVAPGATAAGSEAYTGTYVSFGSNATAVTDYAVDGQTMLSSVQVQSTSAAERSGLVSASTELSAVTSLEGSGLTLSATTETSASVDVEGTASMTAHDNGHGTLVVEAGGEAQHVLANLSTGAQAQSESDSRVTVTTADGVEGTFIVVGDGQVAVNDAGDVSATLGEDSRLAYRAYPDGKSDDDAAQERLIAAGQAAAEVHVMTQNGETVTDTVTYAGETTVDAQPSGDGQVRVTVDRATHEGTVVITTVSESMLDSSGDLSVRVDGQSAASASSYSELQGAIGSDRSKYLVRGSSEADGRADVLVAVNHFSERTVTMSESEGGPATATERPADDDGRDGSVGTTGSAADGSADGGTDATSTPGQPGFGVLVASLALLAAAGVARYRR